MCATLTAEQQRERETDRQLRSVANVNGRPSPTCAWIDEESGADYSVQIIEFPASEALRDPAARVITVAGFGAVRGEDAPLSTPFCQLPIDVADERSIRVQYSGTYDGPRTDQDPEAVNRACRQAVRLAEDVLENLRP